MRKLVTITLVAVLFTSMAAAELTENDLETFKTQFNNQTDQIPSFVGNIVGGEEINVYINYTNSTQTVGASMDGLKIEAVNKDGFDNPTMEVFADQNSISTVLESDEPYKEIQNAFDDKNITYRSTTSGGQIKLSIFKALKDLASAFGLNF